MMNGYEIAVNPTRVFYSSKIQLGWLIMGNLEPTSCKYLVTGSCRVQTQNPTKVWSGFGSGFG